jgi:hypothetical protein
MGTKKHISGMDSDSFGGFSLFLRMLYFSGERDVKINGAQ